MNDFNMKKIIIIFLCYFYTLGSCDVQLTPEEIRRIFGPENHSAGVYGKVDIEIPSGLRTTSWPLSVSLSNGTVRNINLALTEGILAHSATPVWFAHVSEDSKNMNLMRHEENLSGLGLFSFYQDYKSRTSIVVYHDLKKVEGYFFGSNHLVQYDTYENELGQTVTRHVVVMMGRDLEPLPPAGKRPKRFAVPRFWANENIDEDPQKNPLPSVVYPEILLFLPHPVGPFPGEDKTVQQLLTRWLAYWNAVEMLYNVLQEPRVKINIAGFIIPGNNFVLPWIAKAAEGNVVRSRGMLDRLGRFFGDSSVIFPRPHFDIIMGLYQLKPGMTKDALGKAIIAQPDQHLSVAVMDSAYVDDVILGAHQLGHVLGAPDESGECGNAPDNVGIMGSKIDRSSFTNYRLSPCAEKSIKHYLNRMDSAHFDNCPLTKPNCRTSELGPPSCLRDVQKSCQQTPTSFILSMSCETGVLCTDSATGETTLVSANGMTCGSPNPSDAGNILKGCYNGKCVRFDPSTTPICGY